MSRLSFSCDPRRWVIVLAASCLAVALLLAAPHTLRTVRADDVAIDAGTAASVGMDADKLAAIPKRMQEFVEADQISGAVTLVARLGKIVHLGTAGEADLATHRPMRPDTMFAIASMTKPITATAVMILVDEGKLQLYDLASKYIPEFEQVTLQTGQLKRGITIRDLITHTSGLIGEQRNEGTLAETAVKMARRPLAFEPGTKWQYSPGLSICGRIVEVASGQPYEEFLAARILRPLKMIDTTFFPTPEQQQRLASLYESAQDKKSLVPAKHWITDLSPGRTPNPSGGLFSTARDLFRFYQMVLNGGELDGLRIVSKESVAEMTRVQTHRLAAGFQPGSGWGLGWGVVREPQGQTKMLSPGTFGHGGAFGTQGWVDPQREMIFVLLIQRTGFGSSDASLVREAFQQLAVDAVRK